VIYAALAALAGMVAVLVVVMRWGMKAKDDAGHAADRLYAQTKMADETIMALVKDRDDWKQRADVATQQLAAAKVRLTTAETKRNEALQDERKNVADEIRNASPADAARLGNRILSRPLPRLPKADPASPGDGDREAAAVPAAGPAKRST